MYFLGSTSRYTQGTAKYNLRGNPTTFKRNPPLTHGYVYKNGDPVYRRNFRVTKLTFDRILQHLQRGGFLKDGRSTNPDKRIPGRFKLAVALYFFAQGTGYKAAADCA